MNKRNRKILLELVVGASIITAALAACTASTPQPQSEPDTPAEVVPQAIQRVTLEESKLAYDRGAAVFLDVRSASSYTASHIPGALSIPLTELEARLGELDPHQWIITYCT